MGWGYLKSMLTGRPRYPDREFRAFLRRYQWACLFRGKASATAALDERVAAVWSPPDPASPADTGGTRTSPAWSSPRAI